MDAVLAFPSRWLETGVGGGGRGVRGDEMKQKELHREMTVCWLGVDASFISKLPQKTSWGSS